MKQTLTIRVGENQLAKLREMANADDRSVSAIIRRLIDNEIKAVHKMSTRKGNKGL